MPSGTHGNEERELVVENWLVIDWENASTRTRKGEPGPSDLGPREIATQLRLHITIPEIDVPTPEADIEVPAPKVEATELEDVDAEDVPGWQDVADELISRYDIAGDTDTNSVNAVTLETLQEASEKPDVREVRTYVRREIHERERDQEEAVEE